MGAREGFRFRGNSGILDDPKPLFKEGIQAEQGFRAEFSRCYRKHLRTGNYYLLDMTMFGYSNTS